MKRALIIACYIGKLPESINMWIKSCAYNKDYDFMLVTDDKLYDDIPENITVLSQSLDDLKKRFQKCFNFNISLEKPYKLCDFKPLYGIAFEEYVREYEFWGHCDVDMVFGNISSFYTNEIFDKYDRIGTYGHLILYRNNYEINNLYKKKGTPFSYKKVFTSKYNYGFDEQYGYNILCRKYEIKWYDCGHKYCLDKKRTLPYSFAETDNYEHQAVVLKNGKIYHVYDDGRDVIYKEKIYYHFTGTKYNLKKLSDEIVFEYNECRNLNDDIRLYLSKRSVKCDRGLSLLVRINAFWRRSLYQKYIFIKQKIYYYVLWR